METAKLRKFAQYARRSLREQVSAKLKLVLAGDSAARRERAEAVKKLEEAIKGHGNEQVVERVAYIWFNRFCALLLNPTVQERETAFLPLGQGLQCNLVTYFKHGEGRSIPSLLLNEYPPQDAIISVGPNGDGLPSKTALTWLNMQNIRIWRTDLNGTIRVSSDGSTYHVTGGQ